jgi:8-oxo-dGTP pyrophosphatase MutT (NUDIX family)
MNPVRGPRGPVTSVLIERVLHTYWRISRGLTLGVRGAVIDAAGRILLIRHTYVPGWHMPGGGVEAGETALDALARELKEEARVTLTGPVPLHGVFYNRRISRRDHVLVYVVRDFRIDEEKQPDREIAEIGFFPLDALPEGTTRGTLRRVAEIVGGNPASPLW